MATQTTEIVDSKTNSMAAIPTDKSPVFVRDHRPPVTISDRAIWAVDYKGCIGLTLFHLSHLLRVRGQMVIALNLKPLNRLCF